MSSEMKRVTSLFAQYRTMVYWWCEMKVHTRPRDLSLMRGELAKVDIKSGLGE